MIESVTALIASVYLRSMAEVAENCFKEDLQATFLQHSQ